MSARVPRECEERGLQAQQDLANYHQSLSTEEGDGEGSGKKEGGKACQPTSPVSYIQDCGNDEWHIDTP